MMVGRCDVSDIFANFTPASRQIEHGLVGPHMSVCKGEGCLGHVFALAMNRWEPTGHQLGRHNRQYQKEIRAAYHTWEQTK